MKTQQNEWHQIARIYYNENGQYVLTNSPGLPVSGTSTFVQYGFDNSTTMQPDLVLAVTKTLNEEGPLKGLRVFLTFPYQHAHRD